MEESSEQLLVQEKNVYSTHSTIHMCTLNNGHVCTRIYSAYVCKIVLSVKEFENESVFEVAESIHV